jgi:hypothetical protein
MIGDEHSPRTFARGPIDPLENRGGCRPPPHHAELFQDSPATMGGAHQLGYCPRLDEGWCRGGGLPAAATPCGAVPRLACDSGRRGKRSRLDGVGLPAAATPRRAILGLARNYGRRARRPRARSPAAGKPMVKLHAPRRYWVPAKMIAKKKVDTLPHRWHTRDQTACTAPHTAGPFPDSSCLRDYDRQPIGGSGLHLADRCAGEHCSC